MAGTPEDGWVWHGSTRSGHVEQSSFRKQHAKTFETIAKEATMNDLKRLRPFVLYWLRHKLLARL